MINVDKKGKIDSTDVFQWPRIDEKHIGDITTFQARIPDSDNHKPFTIKIELTRKYHHDLVPRYEVSNTLLHIFPNILYCQNKTVTEDEILFQLWYYINKHKLLEGRDNKRIVKCDQVITYNL